MRDIKVKTQQIFWTTELDENNEEIKVPHSLDVLLPIDRVVTIDNNGYVYLYDTCIIITEDMIEEVL